MPSREKVKTATRCAIYTRKSSEEGLEQDFNSLDAQREACEAFILSQKQLGWRALPEMYDDGGVSGATLQRPALKRLLSDIDAGRVDTVVVYKMDRLTRSLGDFAKIVEVLDRRGAAFVSVTQQFNTTTSMGRLILNMLLSFAQFEREVTGERIRDKIAASKKKGLWMGGLPPLGYDVRDRKLVVNQSEAKTVRHIYRRYADLGSVRTLENELDRAGIVSKRRADKHGRPKGGKPLSRGALYLMLQNRIYRGEIVHKGAGYPGQHEAIVDKALWTRAQRRLADNRVERQTGRRAAEPSLLAGLIYDHGGKRMVPSHANKKGRRYRYYVSQSLIKRGRPTATEAARRVPTTDLEALVEQWFISFLRDNGAVHAALEDQVSGAQAFEALIAEATALAERWMDMAATEKRGWLHVLVAHITLKPQSLEIEVRRAQLAATLTRGNWAETERIVDGSDEQTLTLTVSARLKRTGMEKKLLIEGTTNRPGTKPDTSLLKVMARANELQEIFLRGDQPISEMAKAAGVSSSYFTRVLRLSFFAPDITRAVLHGRHPVEINAKRLTSESRIPLDWKEQRARFGFL